MDRNACNEQQVTTIKRKWHAPELRAHGTVADRTGETWDDPDEPECWS